MPSSLPQPIWLLLLSVLPVFADFTQFVFAGNNGTSGAPQLCPSNPFPCAPPWVCSYESTAGRWYCCITGQSDAICWAQAQTCSGGSTSTPGGGQQLCTLGSSKYCCGKTTEQCTETANQINVCWSTIQDPLASLNSTKLNETFSSLSSAHPSAVTYPVSASALLAMTSTTPGASTPPASSKSAATSTGLATTTAPPPSSSSSDSGHKSGLSGGAIGGIVVGVIGGLALACIAGFLLWRSRKNKEQKVPSHELSGQQTGINELSSPPKYHYQHMAEAPNNQAPVELPAVPKPRA